MKKIIGLLTILFITGLTGQELKNVQVLPFTTKKSIHELKMNSTQISLRFSFPNYFHFCVYR